MDDTGPDERQGSAERHGAEDDVTAQQDDDRSAEAQERGESADAD